jgi:hypothetical protein
MNGEDMSQLKWMRGFAAAAMFVASVGATAATFTYAQFQEASLAVVNLEMELLIVQGDVQYFKVEKAQDLENGYRAAMNACANQNNPYGSVMECQDSVMAEYAILESQRQDDLSFAEAEAARISSELGDARAHLQMILDQGYDPE